MEFQDVFLKEHMTPQRVEGELLKVEDLDNTGKISYSEVE
jgi:hypothetical protein